MRTGHSKGAAFVEFVNKKSVDDALNLDGKEVLGMFLFFIFNFRTLIYLA
mgnify:FL=1